MREYKVGGYGSGLAAVDAVIAGKCGRAFCVVRPPGHHANADRGMGFCIFNNIALAARHAQRRHGIRRVLIVDWDVHHGNGTQALVEDEPSIRFVSMHQWPWYPGTGAADDHGPHRSIWNVPMPAARPRAEYVDALNRAVDAATAGWTPDLMIVSAGFDCLAGDPLGGFTLEIDDLVGLTQSLVQRAESWCGGRVVSSLEGGYAPDRLGAAAVAHLGALR